MLRGRLAAAVTPLRDGGAALDNDAFGSHASGMGDAVPVTAPPYSTYEGGALYRHFAAAAEASGETPFYLYEFKGRAGYSIPLPVIERLGDRVAGLKVSNKPFEAVAPYLIQGLDVFIGAETLVDQGLERGAAGSVSGLAAAFPEGGDPAKRAFLERFPFHASLKTVIGLRGVPVREDVRAPLRTLMPAERAEVEQWLPSSQQAPALSAPASRTTWPSAGP